MKTFKTASTTFSALEALGWDFLHVYAAVSRNTGLSLDEAEMYQKENFCVVFQWDHLNGLQFFYQNRKGDCTDAEDAEDYDSVLRDIDMLLRDRLLFDVELW